MKDYLAFVGQKYEDLVKQAKFLALITGNVPSKTDGLETKFYLECSSKGLEFHFDNETRTLKTVVAHNNKFFSYGLENALSRRDVLSVLGSPASSQDEKQIPVIGIIGAWDKYSFESDYYQQISYRVGSDAIECVFYGRDE